MADNSRPVAEPLQKSAQAAQAVRGAVKTGKAIAGAAKGAAAGGVWGAVAGFAWENRKFVGKVIIAATAVLMIPILILCMLPGIIFGGFGNSHSPADPDTPIMNSSAAIDSNLVEISTAVSCVLSEALTDTLTAIENDYAACTADGKEVINPYESSPNFNANLFVGQYCAAKNEDYAAVSVSDMESMLRSGKDKLYSYTKKEEERTIDTVTTSVTVDASTGEETTTETVTTTTEKWIVYTVSYNGEGYFADEVFHLTAEQKDLADDYAYNLSLFLGDSMFQGLPAGYTTVSSLGNIRFTDGQTEVVYFNQLDERYAGQPYGTDNIARIIEDRPVISPDIPHGSPLLSRFLSVHRFSSAPSFLPFMPPRHICALHRSGGFPIPSHNPRKYRDVVLSAVSALPCRCRAFS